MVVGTALEKSESQERKVELDRMAAMLSRLGGRGYRVEEESSPYLLGKDDFDFDPDSDLDENEISTNGFTH